MNKESKKETIPSEDSAEVIQNIVADDDSLGQVMPSINVGVPVVEEEKTNLISDAALMGIYGEVLNNLRDDRGQIDEFVGNFADMVINEGDASSASKEALVSLVRAKIETSDKMSKIADLMTRVKMKEKDTFPRYMANNQENHINIGSDKKHLIQSMNKEIKKRKKQVKESQDE